MPNEGTQQVRIRADVIPSLKKIANDRATTLAELISGVVVEWLEKNDPTWQDIVMLRSVEDRLGEVWKATTVAHHTLQNLEDEEINDYEDRYADPNEANALEQARIRERRQLDSLVASRDKLVAAVVALSGEREEKVRERFSREYD